MTTVVIIGFAVLFFALIMASIALHEVGHLVPAKLFGVKVTQYFVGFGKTLWSRTRGGTEYGFKLIPLGGYVRLVGMYPPGKPGRWPWLDRMADGAREAEAADIKPEDDGSLFYQKKTWQKLIVMFGGPAMNLLLAFLIFLSINMFHGQYRPQLTVAGVSECVIAADSTTRECSADDPPTPAKAAGIEAGDTIVSFNGERLESWSELSGLIRGNLDQPATIVVERDGAEVTLPTVNTVVNGVADPLDPTKTVEAGFLGVVPSYALVKAGPVTTAKDMWDLTVQSVSALASFPVKVWNVTVDMVTGQPRDANGPISVIGASRVAGEVAVNEDIPLGDRAATWFSLLASVNLFVALLNLVPLVPLDGGHMAGAVYEWIKRRLAKLLGRPDPGYADTAKMLPVVYIVGGFLVLAGLVLVIADIVSPLQLF